MDNKYVILRFIGWCAFGIVAAALFTPGILAFFFLWSWHPAIALGAVTAAGMMAALLYAVVVSGARADGLTTRHVRSSAASAAKMASAASATSCKECDVDEGSREACIRARNRESAQDRERWVCR